MGRIAAAQTDLLRVRPHHPLHAFWTQRPAPVLLRPTPREPPKQRAVSILPMPGHGQIGPQALGGLG